jgi:hypothetical protein
MKRTHTLVIGNNGCWAKVPTKEHLFPARVARRKAHNPQHYNVYLVTAETVVSNHGSLQYPGDAVKDAPKLLRKV